MAAVRADAWLYRSNASITIFKEEDHRMGTRKRSNQSEDQIEVVDEQQPRVEVQSESEAPTSAEEETTEPQAEVVEQPKLRRCPSHHRWFTDEDEMRPMDEYRYHKMTGKMLTTYCKRCQSKIHAEYARERRKDSPTTADQMAELRQQLADKEAQLVDAEERTAYLESEIARLEALLNDAASDQAEAGGLDTGNDPVIE